MVAAGVVGSLVAGCGGDSKLARVVERSAGSGARQVWTFQQDGVEPRSVVVFLHGLGGPSEDTPVDHRAWLRHLAAEGSAVVFPRYERYPGDPLAPQFLLATLRAIAQQTDLDEKPLLLLGYARGGGLAVTYATVASAAGMEPRVVVGLFPGINDRQLDPAGTVPGTRFVFYVGDQDEVVGNRGATALRRWLLANDYPTELVSLVTVRSTEGYQATHLSALEDTAGVHTALWDPIDRLVDGIR